MITINEFQAQVQELQRLVYERGFKDGKEQALLSISKILPEELPAEFLNDGRN